MKKENPTFPQQAAKFSLVSLILIFVFNGIAFSRLQNYPTIRIVVAVTEFIIMFVGMGLAVYSLFKIKEYGKKGILAYAVTSLSINLFIIVCAAIAIPELNRIKKNRIENEINSFLSATKKRIPWIIDEATRMDGAERTKAKEVTLYFTLTPYNASEIDLMAWKDQVIPTVRKGIKQTMFYNLLLCGIDVNYRYSGRDGVLISNVLFKAKDYQKK